MVADWTRLCHGSDFDLNYPHIDIKFKDGRRHRVTVRENADELVLSAFVVRQGKATSIPNLPLQIWVRNRALSLVGFRIDHRRRLVAEAWIPKIGITETEFQLYVRTLAIEADRFEYALTGRDLE